MSFSGNHCYIIIGPAAAGKSTFSACLAQTFQKRNIPVSILSDLDELLTLVHVDHQALHHKQLLNHRFEITDQYMYDEAVRMLGVHIAERLNRHDVVIAEIACGEGNDEKFNISFQHRVRLLPKHIIERGRLFYINAPSGVRKRRNQLRKGIARTPDDVFNGLFSRDDQGDVSALFPSVSIVDNQYSKKQFLSLADGVLGL